MTERERLIELYKRATIYAHENYDGDEFDHDKLCGLKVDYLLSNGVIVPPCKVGDTVWSVGRQKEVYEYMVSSIEFGGRENIVVVNLICGGYVLPRETGYYFSDFGKTVFLTREEAEKALKEMEQK